mmetsp:Transcript_23694/g.46553  ORF Transcript_23694/g.46553 Transcript_23694/m.46553 type:complete len:90 (-) Transcript_23694:8-277(-)
MDPSQTNGRHGKKVSIPPVPCMTLFLHSFIYPCTPLFALTVFRKMDTDDKETDGEDREERTKERNQSAEKKRPIHPIQHLPPHFSMSTC